MIRGTCAFVALCEWCGLYGRVASGRGRRGGKSGWGPVGLSRVMEDEMKQVVVRVEYCVKVLCVCTGGVCKLRSWVCHV